jgi:hypothetical protein
VATDSDELSLTLTELEKRGKTVSSGWNLRWERDPVREAHCVLFESSSLLWKITFPILEVAAYSDVQASYPAPFSLDIVLFPDVTSLKPSPLALESSDFSFPEVALPGTYI